MEIKERLLTQAQTLIDLTNDLRCDKTFRRFLDDAALTLTKGVLAIEEKEKEIHDLTVQLGEAQKQLERNKQRVPVSKRSPEYDLEL